MGSSPNSLSQAEGHKAAKAAAEFVELVEISEGDANVAALATTMPN